VFFGAAIVWLLAVSESSDPNRVTDSWLKSHSYDKDGY
jgi:hypothetical protein